MIPKNILREHIEKAISEISPGEIPIQRKEQHYSLHENGKVLPPKYVISLANKFANGKELSSDDFNAVEAKNYLLKHNFNVIDKREVSPSYYVLGAAWYGNENSPDQSERFIQNGIWENGYEDKFLDIVKSVNVGDRVAIKSSYATKDGKSFLRVKATGTVSENPGDGRSLRISWDSRFEPFDLEGFGGYRNTIQKVAEEDIDSIFKTHNDMNYFPELIKFLAQAETDELKTSQYLKSFSGLEVKVSFGQGNQSRIPWIAFLNKIDSVQQGIYPVYLFYKEKKKLILAYGVSETHTSNRTWNLENGKTITDYFSEVKLGTPDRYGSSFVFKVYDTTKSLTEKEINDDLNTLISLYKKTLTKQPKSTKEFQSQLFQEAASNSGLFVSTKTSIRFISSLLTKPFVILTGLSGSGKTKLVYRQFNYGA